MSSAVKRVLWLSCLISLLFASVFGLPLLFLLLFADGTSPSPFTPDPSDVTPSEGLPAAYGVQAAEYAAGKVPLQYISATVEHESGWDPHAADITEDSHAMGLLQFEPETWSGYLDPASSVQEPDTDAQRIATYHGFGLDADNLWLPVGTPAEEDMSDLQKQSRPNEPGYVPYASPYDPFDALKGGVYYMRTLYTDFGGWSEASESYCGGYEWEAYVKAIWKLTYDYVADTTPLSTGNAYFFLGAIPFTAKVGNGQWHLDAIGPTATLTRPPNSTMNPLEYRQTLEQEFVTSVPLIAPTYGAVKWRPHQDGSTSITLPLPGGDTMDLTAWGAVAWGLPKTGGVLTVHPGDVIGFINLAGGLDVDGDLETIYPTLKTTHSVSIENEPPVSHQESVYDPYLNFTPKYPVHDPW